MKEQKYILNSHIFSLIFCFLFTHLSLSVRAEDSKILKNKIVKKTLASKSGSRNQNYTKPPSFATISEAEIYLVPFLKPGQKSNLTVLDAFSNPLSSVTVSIAGQFFKSNSEGKIDFCVPSQDSFEIFILGAESEKIANHKFVLWESDYYCESEILGKISNALLQLKTEASNLPEIVFCPEVMLPGRKAIIIGNNFSAESEKTTILIDGIKSKILAQNDNCIVFIPSNKLSIGPQRELCVLREDQLTNVCEVDLANIYCNSKSIASKNNGQDKSKLLSNDINTVKIGVSGSNLPSFALSLESEFRSEKSSLNTLSNLNLAFIKAQIMRLERRRIYAEFRLQEVRKKIAQEISLASKDSLKLDNLFTESKALSLRIFRLSNALSARNVIFITLGASDNQYRQALDEAASGAYLSLDQACQPVSLDLENLADLKNLDIKDKNIILNQAKFHRSLQPVIKLWPPKEFEDINKIPSPLSEELFRDLIEDMNNKEVVK